MFLKQGMVLRQYCKFCVITWKVKPFFYAIIPFPLFFPFFSSK